MTDREKAIVMAYTGVCMLTGDKLDIFHKYIEDIMGRPVYTHEIAFLENEIKERSKDDFIKLCADKSGQWIKKKGMIYCSECGEGFDVFNLNDFIYCPSCGEKMEADE